MKTRLAIWLLAALAGSGLFAGESRTNAVCAAQNGGLDVIATFDVTSGYLLYGALMNSEPCAQTGVEPGWTMPNGWGRFGVAAWSNSDLTDRRQEGFRQPFNENDFYLHYGNHFEMTENVAFALRVMHMWYWYPNDHKDTGKGCPSKKELYLIGSLENPWIVPYAMFTHEYQLTDGSYFECGVRRRFEIADGLSVTPSFSGNCLSQSYMTIFPPKRDGEFCELGIGCLKLMLEAEYAITESVSLRSRVAYVSIVNDELRGAIEDAHGSTYYRDFFWGSVGVALTF